MRYFFRRLFRTRCLHYIGRGTMIWSIRAPDRLEEDGSFTEGTHIAEYGSIKCHRRRWHRGEHRE